MDPGQELARRISGGLASFILRRTRIEMEWKIWPSDAGIKVTFSPRDYTRHELGLYRLVLLFSIGQDRTAGRHVCQIEELGGKKLVRECERIKLWLEGQGLLSGKELCQIR